MVIVYCVKQNLCLWDPLRMRMELTIHLSSKPWSSQFLTQFKQFRTEAWKSQDFNGVWTRDLATPVRRSNQLSYEATDVESWSFVSSNEPVRNRREVIYEMFHIHLCLQSSIAVLHRLPSSAFMFNPLHGHLCIAAKRKDHLQFGWFSSLKTRSGNIIFRGQNRRRH